MSMNELPRLVGEARRSELGVPCRFQIELTEKDEPPEGQQAPPAGAALAHPSGNAVTRRLRAGQGVGPVAA